MLNPNIILQGQAPDIVGAMHRGATAGTQMNQIQQENALAQIVRQHGPAAMGGDVNALGAIAGMGPRGLEMAQGTQANALNMDATRLGMDATRLGMDATRQDMRHAEAQQDRLSRQEQREYAAQLAQQDAAKVAAERDRLAGVFRGAAQLHAAGDQQRYGDFLRRNGINPADLPWDSFPAEAAKFSEDILPIYDEALARNGGRDIGEVFEEATNIRKEWSGNASVKAFAEQAAAFGRIQASAADPSPAGDLSMIFNYMKVLDPGSVVRESEFATAESAAAWLQQSEELGIEVPLPIANGIRRMATGQRLSPEQRADFADRAARLYDGAEQQYDGLFNQFKGILDRNGIPVEDALIDYRYSGDRFAPELPPETVPTPAAPLSPEILQLYDKYRVSPEGGQ